MRGNGGGEESRTSNLGHGDDSVMMVLVVAAARQRQQWCFFAEQDYDDDDDDGGGGACDIRILAVEVFNSHNTARTSGPRRASPWCSSGAPSQRTSRGLSKAPKTMWT